MMRSKRAAWIGGSVVVVLAVGAVGVGYALRAAADDPFMAVYGANCAVCHGEDMAGGPQGPALIGGPLAHGESIAELVRSIADGYPASGMPTTFLPLRTNTVSTIAPQLEFVHRIILYRCC
jgi:mono/diheme cytochrome c family protein